MPRIEPGAYEIAQGRDFVDVLQRVVVGQSPSWIQLSPVDGRTLPNPDVTVVDADPRGVTPDLEKGLQKAVDTMATIWEDPGGDGAGAEVVPDWQARRWVRWVDMGSLRDEGTPLSDATMIDAMLTGPSGSASHVVYGKNTVSPDNIVDHADLSDRADVDRLKRSVFSDFLSLGVVKALKASQDPSLQPDMTPDAIAKSPLVRSIAELDPFAVLNSYEIDARSLNPWIEATESGLQVRSEILDALQLIEYEANRLVPAFVQQLGRIQISVKEQEDWADGARVEISVLPVDINSLIPLGATGRGAQRWITVSIREALRRMMIDKSGVPDRPRLLLIDEPEMALHPAAQEEVARWCVTAARDGQHVVVATHSPAFLDLPPSSVSVALIQRLDGATGAYPLEVSALAGLDVLGEMVGLGRASLMYGVRGFLAVEGPADAQVLATLMGAELRALRIVMVPLHGHFRIGGLIQPHLFEALGRPVAVMLDDVAAGVVDGTLEPQTNEEKTISKVLKARESGVPIHAIAFEAPDIMCALPEDAVRRIRPAFRSWKALVASHDPSEGNFKTHALLTLQYKKEMDRRFISEVLDSTSPSDPRPATFERARREILSWAENLSGDA